MKKRSTLSEIITKTFANQFATILFSLTLIPLFLFLKLKANVENYMFFHSLTSVALMCVLIYQLIWKLGWSDNGRVKRAEEKENKFKGFLGCSIAIAPFAFIALIRVVVLGMSLHADSGLVVIFNWLQLIFNLPFLGLFDTMNGYIATLFFIIPIIVGGLAYILGYKGIVIHQYIMYKKPTKDNK